MNCILKWKTELNKTEQGASAPCSVSAMGTYHFERSKKQGVVIAQQHGGETPSFLFLNYCVINPIKVSPKITDNRN